VYSSIETHQSDDPFCKDGRAKLVAEPAEVDKFSVCKNLPCYYPKGAKRRRCVVPTLLRPMLIKYFHDTPLAEHLGAFKTLHKVATNFWWPQMRADVFRCVRNCYLCQRGKPAPNTRVGLHDIEPSAKPLEKFFVDFVGPLTRTKRGNSANLVVLDSFSIFVSFFLLGAWQFLL